MAETVAEAVSLTEIEAVAEALAVTVAEAGTL